MLSVEASFSQNTLSHTGADHVVYLLLKLVPQQTGGVAGPRRPLDIALLIDNSGSMYDDEGRVQKAIDAAGQALGMLDAQDRVTFITFADRASILHPLSYANTPTLAQSLMHVMSMPSGGTNIPDALSVALNELQNSATPDRTRRILLLTDGKTENPDACQPLAVHAASAGIGLSTFGLGTDWNEHLTRSIADTSGGTWRYIAQAQDIAAAFTDELQNLQSTAYSNVVVSLRLFQNDTVQAAKIVSPSIKDIEPRSTTPKTFDLYIGTASADTPVYVLVTLSLVMRDPGRYNVAIVKASYDFANQHNQTTAPQSLVMSYVEAGTEGFVNGEVLRWVDAAQVDSLVREATQIAAGGDSQRATQLFENARTISERRGDKAQTRMISAVLDELGGSGTVSRATQLQAIDQSRKTKLMASDDMFL